MKPALSQKFHSLAPETQAAPPSLLDSESFNFDQWVRQVRPQLLACLNRSERTQKTRHRKLRQPEKS